MCCVNVPDINGLFRGQYHGVGSFAITCCSVFYHYGVRSNATCLSDMCLTDLYLTWCLLIMLECWKRVRGHERLGFLVMLRMSDWCELILRSDSPRLVGWWRLSINNHTWVVLAAGFRSPAHTLCRSQVISECVYMWRDVQCVCYMCHIVPIHHPRDGKHKRYHGCSVTVECKSVIKHRYGLRKCCWA